MKYQSLINTPIHSMFSYLPTKYDATPNQWRTRGLVWDFKAGQHTEYVAKMIAAEILQHFGCFAENLVFACIPASNPEANETRYKEFSALVCQYTGAESAYNHIRVNGKRYAVHEHHNGEKELKQTYVVDFDEEFFNGKKVIVFDDVITSGNSYVNFSRILDNFGAEVLSGFFLAKTMEMKN